MRDVGRSGQFKILELEVVDFSPSDSTSSAATDVVAGELQLRLLDVVAVEMQVAEGVDEFAGLRPQTCATISVSMA